MHELLARMHIPPPIPPAQVAKLNSISIRHWESHWKNVAFTTGGVTRGSDLEAAIIPDTSEIVVYVPWGKF